MANPLWKILFPIDPGTAERDLENYLSGVAARPIEPEAYVPLSLDQNHLFSAFNDWLRGLRFVPGQFKKTAMLDEATAMYVPVWLVRGTVHARYCGERGTDRKEKETQTDAAGNTQEREVTKTHWHPVEGSVQHSYEDVVVCGWSGVPDAHAHVLKPKPGSLQPYAGGNTGAHPIQSCAIGAREAFKKADSTMEAEVRRLVERDIGGDKQRIDAVESQHVGVSLKHVLMPVYRGRYRYRNKDYWVTVNAATGEAAGDHPISATKIVFTVLAGIAVLAAIIIGLILLFKK